MARLPCGRAFEPPAAAPRVRHPKPHAPHCTYAAQSPTRRPKQKGSQAKAWLPVSRPSLHTRRRGSLPQLLRDLKPLKLKLLKLCLALGNAILRLRERHVVGGVNPCHGALELLDAPALGLHLALKA